MLGAYAYDDFGRRTSLARGNGTVTTYSFDPASRLTALVDDLAGSAADTTTTMTYNPAGQIATRARSNDAYVWTGGLSVNRDYATNGLNQYNLIASSIVPTYDGRGNLTGTGQSVYGYNIDNQLVSSSAPAATLSYDPLGRLYRITGGTPTRFNYDGSDLIGEYDDLNVMQRRYVHGPGTDEPLVWYEGSGTTDRRWLQSDERGSVVGVSNVTGAPLGINTYDEHGIPGAANIGRFQYTGQMWLPELGMYHFKARVYSPTLGRFLQPDPIGYGDGMNQYAYAGGDPINRRDPRGTDIIVIGNRGGGFNFFNFDFFFGSYFQPSFFFPSFPSFGGINLTPPAADPNNCDKASGDDGCAIVVTGTRQKVTIDSSPLGVNVSITGFSPVVLAASAGALNNIYRMFVPDPCAGQGTNEKASGGGYDPYDLPPEAVTAGVAAALAKHGPGSSGSEFNSYFSDPINLAFAIGEAIQTNPLNQGGRGFRYTVNLGRITGIDRVNGGSTNYLTVAVRVVDNVGTIATAYPGCPKVR